MAAINHVTAPGEAGLAETRTFSSKTFDREVMYVCVVGGGWWVVGGGWWVVGVVV